MRRFRNAARGHEDTAPAVIRSRWKPGRDLAEFGARVLRDTYPGWGFQPVRTHKGWAIEGWPHRDQEGVCAVIGSRAEVEDAVRKAADAAAGCRVS